MQFDILVYNDNLILFCSVCVCGVTHMEVRGQLWASDSIRWVLRIN